VVSLLAARARTHASRRTPCALSVVVLATLASLACGADQAGPAPPHPDRWNVLLIMAEDLSPRLGAYGDTLAHTPNIDRLAREGMRFTRAFTTAGVCAPSRSAIILGVHQNRWGAGAMRVNLPRGDGLEPYTAVPPATWKAYPELLRRAGYHTSNQTKTDYALAKGLRGMMGGGPSTIWDDPTTGDWRARAPGQAFFTQLNPQMTHESRVWPTFTFGSLNAWLLFPFRAADHWHWPQRTDPADVVLPPYYVDTPTARADVARHYDDIAYMDEVVGEQLARLEADGLADRTVVIFTTDHGDGLPRAKRWLYDSGIHVPLIVRWPGVVAPGTVNEELVSLVDLAPTILSIAGLPIPDHMEGRVVVGPDAGPEPAYVYAARDRMDTAPDTVRAVRDRRFAYVRHFVPGQPYVLPIAFRDTMPMMQELLALADAGALEGPPALWFRPTRDPEELFDLDSDPHEIVNLAGDPAHAATLARLRAALDRRLAAHDDLGLIPETALRARFYPDGKQPETAPPAFEVSRHADALRVRFVPGTAHASIRHRVDGGPWRVSTEPIALETGACIEASAVRYGWAESETVERCFE
jgi:arylsulfatase A-like enzyme